MCQIQLITLKLIKNPYNELLTHTVMEIMVFLTKETSQDITLSRINGISAKKIFFLHNFRFSIKKIKSCIACNKRVEASSETLGQCVKCSAFQRLDRCASDVSAKVLIESNGNRHTLHMYLHSICQIPAGDDLTADTEDETISLCLTFIGILSFHIVLHPVESCV